MAMSKHTPGPWKLHRIDSDTVFVTEDRIARGESIPGYNRKLVEMPHWSDDNYDEKMANTRLIAAAPELLEALKKVFEDYASPDWRNLSTNIDLMKAAIAKAEGTDAD